jgi:hypothetical protein
MIAPAAPQVAVKLNITDEVRSRHFPVQIFSSLSIGLVSPLSALHLHSSHSGPTLSSRRSSKRWSFRFSSSPSRLAPSFSVRFPSSAVECESCSTPASSTPSSTSSAHSQPHRGSSWLFDSSPVGEGERRSRSELVCSLTCGGRRRGGKRRHCTPLVHF